MISNNHILCGIKNNIGILTFNRPEKRNALSPEMLAFLHLKLTEWAKNDLVRTVIITGVGDNAFSSGFDLQAVSLDAQPELSEVIENDNAPTQALNTLKKYPYPTIAMMNGDAVGLALNLALCCDIRISADDIKVCMPPVKLGAVYHAEGIKQFIEIIGVARTRELFMTGRFYKGNEVMEMGLVNKLVPRAQLTATTYAMASDIVAKAPLALKGIKHIVDLLENTLVIDESILSISNKLMNEAFQSQDMKEGKQAFLEKRKPKFIGC